MSAQFFIARPVCLNKKAEGQEHCTLYATAEGSETLMWSGDMPLPSPGDEITITMNGIGPAIVKGYFSEGGYLGVMTFATNPPEWLRKQRGPNREQLQAIHDWAIHHGPRWKERLRDAWRTVNYGGFKEYWFLQQVRNQLGPAWLIDFDMDTRAMARMLKRPDWEFEGIGCEFGSEIEIADPKPKHELYEVFKHPAPAKGYKWAVQFENGIQCFKTRKFAEEFVASWLQASAR